MNTFEVLLWLTRTFGIQTLNQLWLALVALDLALHFVSSSLAGWAAFSSTRYVLCLLFSQGGSPPGMTTLEGKLIYLCSLGSLFFASWLMHCWLDYGSRLWVELGRM